VDDATRYMWINLIPPRVMPHPPSRRSRRTIELEVGKPPQVLQTDNYGEFMTKDFAVY
jgi:hypothetical protein